MTATRSQPGALLCRAALVFLLLVAPSFGWAQTNAPAASTALPPAAQEALNKGIIAAKVPDYPLAIRFFQDARKLAPAVPVIFFNLGIAESKIPGRELRAMAWFGAYLAANPDAPNAVAVREQIAVLDVRNQSNVSRLIKTAQDAARQIISHQPLADVARLWAEFGDINAALNTVKLMKNDDIYGGSAQNGIAGIQAVAGDIAGALQTASLITRPDYRSGALRFVGQIQFASGDIAGAQKTLALAAKTAERIDNLQTKGHQLGDIASAQAEAGDIAGAQKSVALIQGARAELSKTTLSTVSKKLVSDGNLRSEATAQSAIAIVQAKSGDVVGAQKTADFIKDAKFRSQAQRAVAEAQTKAGDIAGARKTLAYAQKAADLIQPADYFKASEQYSVARAQIKAGDIAGAQRSADLIKDTDSKKSVQREIAEAQAKIGIAAAPNSTRQSTLDTKPPIKPVTVSDWIKELEGDLNTGPFLDLAGYLKSLPPSADPRKVFDGLHKTAETIVKEQNSIQRMRKQQANR